MKGTKVRKNRNRINRSFEPFFSGKGNASENKTDLFFKKADDTTTTTGPDKTSEPKKYPALRYGARGNMVELLQNHLNSCGFSIAVDGIFGSETHGAVRKFQAIYAPPVDGIVGPITWRALTADHKTGKDKSLNEDYLLLAQNMYEVNHELKQEATASKHIFALIIQQTGNKFSQLAKSKAVGPGSTAQAAGVLPLKTQLDVLLKSIAIAIGFEGMGKANSNEMLNYQRALVLHLLVKYVEKSGLSQISQAEVNLFLHRANLMRDFYNSFLNNGNFSPTPGDRQTKSDYGSQRL